MKRLVKILFFVTAICLAVATFTACNGKEQKDFTTEYFTIEQAYAYAEGLGYEGTLEEFVAMLSGKDGVDGVGIATVAISADGHLLVTLTDEKVIDCGELPTVKGEKGDQGEKGDTGAIGNGIFSIEKTATNGLVDTYTITFTDGTTTTYTITNGESGEQGVGIFSMEKTRSNCTKDIYTVTYTDGDIDEIEVDNNGSGHVYGEWSEVIESTCSTYGIRVRLCKVCDESDFGVIEKKTHSWGTWKSFPATCTEDGLRERTCIDCGEKEQEIIPASGHDIIHHEGKAATCTDKGWKAYETCSRCDYTTYEEIDVLGHNVIDGECTRCHKHEYTIHVEYQYTDGTIASDTVEKTLWEGTRYEIVSPVIENYTADKTTVSGIADANKNVVVVYTRVSVERIVSIETVNLGNVEYNAPYSELGLPNRVNGRTESGKTVSLEVYWNSSEYHPTTYGAQTISGLVVSAYGYAMDANTAYATVNVLGNVITRINEMNLGKLPLGTDYDGLGLPTTAGVTTASGAIYYMPVTWNTYEYDKTIAGTHSINGTLTLESGFAFAAGVENRATITFELSEKMYGTADIVFIVDTTGSMWDEIQNVKNNINRFAETLEAEGVSVRWALLEYRDITCDGNNSTKIIYCGSSEWYINVAEYEKAIATLSVGGGGDREETVIDALAAATYLDTRSGAKTFHIVVTDADYKVENNYGIANMTEMINVLKASEIVASTVTKTMYYDVYRPLTDGTGGILANIDGNFANELWKLCDLITEEVVYGDVAYIEIISQPTKTVYNVGDYFDGNGMVVRAHYTRGRTRVVTGYSVSPCRTLQLSDTYVEINHRGKTANVAITVKELSVPVTGVNVSTTSVTIVEGETNTVTAAVMPTNATNKNVVWETMNPNVAVVTDGRITAIGAGTTTVRVTTADGRYTKTINVTVTAKAVPVTGIYVDKGALELNVGESKTITATVLPMNATNKALVWTSTNTSVATVTNGVVTAVGEGNATIKVMTVDGSYTAMSYVSVTIVDPSITMIYTLDQLRNASGTVMLGADITSSSDACILFRTDVVLYLNNHSITCTDDVALRAIDGAKLTIYGPGNVYAQEACVMPFNGATLIINGGTYTAIDNFIIGTNGTNGRGNNTITINDGTFNGGITTMGYVACGVYVANNDTVVINAGTFNITNGAGILMRSGSTTIGADVMFNVTGDGHLGKVGDSRVTVPTGEVIVLDFSANYPGGDPALTNNSGYEVYVLVENYAEFVMVKDMASTIILYGDINAGDNDIVFSSDITLDLNGHTVTFASWGFEVRNGATLTINGNGGSITAAEACLYVQYAGKLVVNGGTYTSTNNFVIGTNASNGRGNNEITINAGTFNGNIQSAGYIACGIYVANNDTVVINGGTFNITNGCGVLARSGNTTINEGVVFNVIGDGTLGGVGERRFSVPAGEAIVLDLSANYPGGLPTLINNTDYEVYVIEAEYTITFVNYDGTVLQTLTNQAYHTTPVYTGATPTKEADAQYTYEFTGWSPAIIAVTEDTIYTAVFTSVQRSFTITFENWNGTVLYTLEDQEYGSAPVYVGETPTRAETIEFSYTFIGWTPEIAEVTGSTTYTAVYGRTAKPITDANGLIYRRNGNDKYTVVGYEGTSSSVIIPNQFNNIDVTMIGAEAFASKSSLTYIRIGANISYIWQYAFNHTTAEVVWYTDDDAAGITIGENAFNGYMGYRIYIPNGVASIGASAFANCTYLNDIRFGSGLKTIGYHAFYKCTNLRTLNIPSGVSIGEGAFSNCSQLTNLTIPYLNNMSSLFDNQISNTLSNVTVLGGEISASAFSNCYMLNAITFGQGVTTIADGALTDCRYLQTISFNRSAYRLSTLFARGIFTAEGGSAFVYTGTGSGGYIYQGEAYVSRERISSLPIKYRYSYYGYSIPSTLRTININKGYIPNGAFYNCNMLTEIVINDQVTGIGANAFYNCTGLTSITIPNSVTSIGENAFYGCSNLTGIHYTGDIASWCGITLGKFYSNSNAFYNIKHKVYIDDVLLTEIVIPDTVTEIKAYTFYNWYWTTKITIPDSVTIIGESSFFGCSGLTNITIPDNVTSIGNSAFSGCSKLTSVTIPDNVTSIGNSAFSGCSKLTSVTIGACVTDIGSYAFSGCSKLASVTIGACVTDIGVYAFQECHSLTSITIPDSVTSIGEKAFYNCIGLMNLTIGSSVTTVGSSAFLDCYYLVEVYNKSTLTITKGSVSHGYAGYYAKVIYTEPYVSRVSTDENGYVLYVDEEISLIRYYGTDTVLTLPEELTEINQYAFYNNKTITSITIPDSVVRIGGYSFSGCSGLINITFEGTMEQWNAISKGDYWNYNTGTYVVHCTDGDLDKNGNEILESTTYTITFVDDDGTTVLDEQEVAYGVTPVYAGETPTKAATAQYAYTFNGWSPAITMVEGDATYTATYSSVVIQYTVTFVDDDGMTVLDEQVVAYGSTPTYTGATPTKVATEQYTYTFVGWTPEITIVTGNATYVATYTSELISYSEGLQFTSNGDGTCYVSGIGTCADDDIIIPSVSPDGDSVIAIGEMAFKDTDITSVTIPVGVTSIGNMAFYSCSCLSVIMFSEGLTEIRNGAFSWCDDLTEVTLPESLISVGDLFVGCIALESIRIPANVIEIGEGAFSCCVSLETITVDDGNPVYYSENNCIITRDDHVLIVGCKNSVIPNTVEEIGSYSFYYCTDLTYIEIPESVISIDVGVFTGCSGLTDIVLANSVMEIGDYAFHDCNNILNVYYGGTEDERSAITVGAENDYFENANWYYYSEDYPLYFESNTYWHYVDGEIVIWEEEYEEQQLGVLVYVNSEMLYYGYEYLDPQAIVVNQNLEEIQEEYTTVFKYYYENGEEVDGIPMEAGKYTVKAFITMKESGKKVLGETMFELFECDGEFSYRVNEDNTYGVVRYVGTSAVVTVPATFKDTAVTVIDRPGFNNRQSVVSISIPASVTSIGDMTLFGCNNLISISVDDNNLYYCSEDDILFNKDKTAIIRYPAGKSTETYVMPSFVISIGVGAFEGCSTLTSLTLSENLTAIGRHAFDGCSNLTEISIPTGVTSIGEFAFAGCYAELDWGDDPSITFFDSYLFNCYYGESITIPATVQAIRQYAFYECSMITAVYYEGDIASWCGISFDDSNPLSIAHSLYIDNTLVTEIVIPNTVTEIKDSAFCGWNGTSIMIPYGVTSIGENAFYGCNGLVTIIIPDTVTYIGRNAFSVCNALQYNTYGNAEYLGNAINPYLVLIKATDKAITECIIHEDCKFIYDYAFENCGGLTSIVIPDKVISVGEWAFAQCRNLTSITIPVSVARIEEFACYYCENLKDVYYQGTMEQGIEVEMNELWNHRAGEITIHCTDGDITL